jgi:acetyl esterase/lipase
VTRPDFLSPFVLSTPTRPAERHGPVDLYLPDTPPPRPAVVIVHGGPMPAAVRPTPREWPVYQGYASALAERGVVAVTVDHGLHHPGAYPQAAADVAAAVELARADPRVDADRIAVWFFSGSGLLLADWLREPPPWLRGLAASYPFLAPFPGWDVDPRFRPIEAVTAGPVPIVLTRVGRENPTVAAEVDAFVAAATAAGARLEVIDVPDGQHSFDCLDHTDQSRAAVERALAAVLATLA